MTPQHIAMVILASNFKGGLIESEIESGIKAYKGELSPGKGLITQRLEFDPNTFTADRAKKWMKKNAITFSSFTEVEPEDEPMSTDPTDVVVAYGAEVKALGEGKVAGYLIRFTDEKSTDLSGDFFQADTDFGDAKTTPTLYNHALDVKIGNRKLGEGTLKVDEVGVWIESQLQMRDAYEKAIYLMVEAGKMGWSSGTASHLVRRKKVGEANKIMSWPLGLDASLTPTPAEPRNSVVAFKSLQATEFHIEPDEAQSHSTGKGTPMEDATKNAGGISAEELKNTVSQVLAKQKEAQEAEIKKQADKDALVGSIMELVGSAMKNAPAVNRAGAISNGGVEFKDAEIDSKKNELKAFWGYVRGKISDHEYLQYAAKTAVALNEGDNEQGLVLVPVDFYSKIVAKRDEVSIMRAAGATVIQTALKVVDIPIEGTREAKFVVPGEATAYDENAVEPFDKVTATILKYTRLIKMSEELVADQAANLEPFFADRLGRAAGITENDIFLTGASTLGAVTTSGLGATAPSLSAISAANVMDLYYSLSQPYREGAAWVMRGATEGYVRKLTQSGPFSFVQTPQGLSGATGFSWLVGPNNRVFNSDEMDAIGSAAKSILFANMSYYYIVERQGMAIRRLTELYAATGQIGFLASFRVGGAVTQSEAFKHLLHPTTT